MAFKTLSVHFTHCAPIAYHVLLSICQHVNLYLVDLWEKGEGPGVTQSSTQTESVYIALLELS